MKIFTKKLFTGICCSLLLLLTSAIAMAAPVSYTGLSGGNWSVPGNWSGGAIPLITDDVTIPVSITVNVTGSTPCQSLTLDGTIIISAGATLTVDGPVSVSGTLRNGGVISNTGAITFLSGGIYQHNYTTTAGTIPTATWDTGSTCQIVGYTSNTATPSGLGQSFYNFTWNCPNQAGVYGNLNGELLTVNGNFTMTTGTLYWLNSGGSGTRTLTIGGNMLIQGGTLNWSNTGGTYTPEIDLAGAYTQTGGTFTSVSTTPATLKFMGATATFAATGTLTTTRMNFEVDAGGSLTMNNNLIVSSGRTFTVDSGGELITGTRVISGTGSFVLSGGASMTTTNANGLSTTGSITTTTRTFSSAANYEFSGAITGIFTTTPTALTVNNLTINRTGTTVMSQNFTVNSLLTLTLGTFSLGTNTLTLNNDVSQAAGAITSSATGTVNYSLAADGQHVASGSYGKLIFNNFNKIFPEATVNIAGAFTTGTATGHTITNNTINFNGAAGQVIPAFSYYNLSCTNINRTLQSTGVIHVINTFSPAGTYTNTGSTIDFNGSDQNIPSITGGYNLLTTSNSGVKSLTANVTVAGKITVGSGTELDLLARTLTLSGTGTPIQVDGTFTPSTGTVSFTGTGQTIPALNYYNLTSSTGNRTLAAGVIGVANTFNAGTGTHTITGNTINFNGSGTQLIPAITPNYNNVTLSNAGSTKNLNSSGTVAGVLTVDADVTFSLLTRTLTLTGSDNVLVVNGIFDASAGTVAFSGPDGQVIPALDYYKVTSSNTDKVLASGTIGISNALTPGSGSYTTAGSTIVFNGTGNQNIPPLSPAYNNLMTETGGVKTLATPGITVDGLLTVGLNTTLALSSRSLTLKGPDVPIIVLDSLSYGTSTVIFAGTASQTIPPLSYYNLTATNTALTLPADTIRIFNVFTPGSGTYTPLEGSTVSFERANTQTIPGINYYNLKSLNFARTLQNGGTISIAGEFTPGTGTYTTTNSTVIFNGAGNQDIPVFTTGNYNNITTSEGGTKTIGGNISTAGTVTVGDGTVLDLSNRTLTLTKSGAPLIVDGAIGASTSTVIFNGTTSTTIPAADYYNLSSSNVARVLASSGTINIANIFSPGTNTYTTTGSTVNFNGSGDQAIPSFNTGNYNNLSTSIGGIKTMNSSETVNGVVNVGANSTLDLGATTLTLALNGTPMVVDGDLDAGTSTVSFTGTGNQVIPAAPYYNLSSSNVARTLQSSGTIDISHTFTPGTNTYTTTGSTVNFSSGSAQAVPVGSNLVYNNLSLSGLGTKTITAASSMQFKTNNNYVVNAPVAYSNISSVYVTGDFDGTQAINTDALAVTIGDDWKNTATGYTLTGDVSYTGETDVTLEMGGVGYTNLNITASRGAGFPVTTSVSAPLTIGGILTVGDNATFATGDSVTLLSTAASFANVAPLTGSANISGNMNVQLYFTGGEGKRGSRMISAPINESTMLAGGRSFYQQLKENMVVTGPGGEDNGFDKGSAASPFGVTLTKYNEPATSAQSQFTAVGSLLTGSVAPAQPGEGAFLFYRGDRTGYNAEDPGNPKLMPDWVPESFAATFTGPVNQGDISIALTRTDNSDATYDGYNVIGNPYPATIDWEKVYAANAADFANEIRVIQPGGAVMSRKNVDDIVTVINDDDLLASQYIQPGQGFYIRKTTAGTTNFNFSEADKEVSQVPDRLLSVPTQHALMSVPGAFMGASNSSAVQFYFNLKDAVNTDEAAIVFKEGFDANFDTNDAPYLSGSTVILSSLSADGKPNAINYVPALGDITAIRLNVNAAASGPLTLNFTSVAALGHFKAKLRDNYLNTLTDIKSNPSYAFNIDRTVAASFGAGRFVLEFEASAELTINLSAFTAVQQQRNVQLNWVTSSEQSSVRFEVERSSDGVNFVKIGEKAGAGSSEHDVAYAFMDANPVAGTNTYRLKQVYTDGSFSYSDTRTVSYIPPADNNHPNLPKISILVFPNPASDVLHISLSNPLNVKVVIYDLFGRTLKSGTFTAGSQISFNINSLKTGIYFAEVRDQATGKLIEVTIFLKR